jgi:rhodanese-related sulfurtransferase
MKFIHKFKYLIILFAFATLSACAVSEDFNNTEGSGNLITSSSLIHDWGDINIQGGDVSHSFQFTNDGEESLYLKGAETSCMCTTATYHLPDGSKSPVFGMHNNPTGWSAEIKPGENFEVEAIYDPMAHGPDAVGIIQRSITLATSDPDQSTLELKVGGEVLYEEDYEKKNLGPVVQSSSKSFEVLQPKELQSMLEDKDFFLLDVHIPEQEHIPGTDAFIDYRELAENQDQLPEDKDEKIVVYCRSGSMSRAAVNDLVELGYTNVYDLEGGINAFNALED